MLGLDLFQHLSHALIEFLGEEDLIIAAAVDDIGRDVPGHGRPMDVRFHWLLEPDGVAREQQETAEAGDLIEVCLLYTSRCV